MQHPKYLNSIRKVIFHKNKIVGQVPLCSNNGFQPVSLGDHKPLQVFIIFNVFFLVVIKFYWYDTNVKVFIRYSFQYLQFISFNIKTQVINYGPEKLDCRRSINSSKHNILIHCKKYGSKWKTIHIHDLIFCKVFPFQLKICWMDFAIKYASNMSKCSEL